MMHGPEKSDSPIVAVKPANKAGKPAAEWVEPRGGTKRNTGQPRTRRTHSRASVSQGLERVRRAARQRKKEKFTTLLHHVTLDELRDAFLALKRRAALGVDGVTWEDYETNLEGNLQALHARVHGGTYRALPVRRRLILKPDGKQRPLGITALEDKIVQRAVVAVLNAIYEEDFLGCSYGFRPGRSQHDALDALCAGITGTPVNWILDADSRSFFDRIDQTWLVRFLEHRVGDERVIRLVRKWLKAGVLDEGGNERQCTGDAVRRGDLTSARMMAKLKELKAQLRERLHEAIPEQGKWLKAVVTGYFAYHAVPTNSRALGAFRYHVTDLWRRTLKRRSQKDGMTWDRITKIAAAWLPPPRTLYPWPDRRFAVKHPRWEPSA